MEFDSSQHKLTIEKYGKSIHTAGGEDSFKCVLGAYALHAEYFDLRYNMCLIVHIAKVHAVCT